MSLLSTSQITIVDLEDGRTQYTHLAWCNLGENGKKETVYPSFTKDPEAGRNLTHIGIYQDFNAAGSDNPKDYNWSQWLGYDGKDGIPGKPGADGRTPYIHFAYADSADGRTGFTTSTILSDGGDIDSPVTVTKVDVSKKLYMGTYTDYNVTDSNNPTMYTWQKVRGADGANGVPGKPGVDGRTPYIHFAYADSADGRTGFTVTGAPDKKYMGTYTDFNQPDSTDPTRYIWTKIKGEDGAPGRQGIQGLQGPKGDQGIPGQKGTDGRTPYIHIAYADTINGAGFSQTDTNKPYMGVYHNYDPVDSSNPLDYRWTKVKGDDGANGLPGAKGADGKTPYIHFAYANSSDGRTDFSVSAAANKAYIGTYNDFTEADSTDPTKYKWTKVKGADGADGAPGKSSYAHFAYANSSDGRTDFSTTESYNRRFVGTYTDSNEADSTDPTKYKWIDMVGGVKVGGRNLWVNSRATGYSAIETLPENHITGQRECYRIETGYGKNNLRFNIAPDFTKRFYTTLTVSAWVKYENVKKGPNPWQGFNCFKSIPLYRRNSKTNAVSPAEYLGMFNFDGSSDWKRIEVTYDYGSDPKYDELKMDLQFLLEDTQSGKAWITGIKVETGTVATDYTLSSEDYEVSLSKKADQTLTQEQINKLSERNELLKAEMEAKASQDIVDTWIQSIKNLTATEEAGRKDAEAAVIRASERINELQKKIGELKITTEFVNTYMSQSEEGLIVGQKDGSSKVLVSSDRISFVSGGKEVASISQGVLQIDNGVFVKSLRIGRFVTIQDPTNADRNLTMYVGGV